MGMDRAERKQLREIIHNVEVWVSCAQGITTHRQEVTDASDDALNWFRSKITHVAASTAEWQFLPLHSEDTHQLGLFIRPRAEPPLNAEENTWLRQLTQDIPAYLSNAQRNFGFPRFFMGPKKRHIAEQAGRYLINYKQSADRLKFSHWLQQLEQHNCEIPYVDVRQALDPDLGLTFQLGDFGDGQILPSQSFVRIPSVVEVIRRAGAFLTALLQQISDAVVTVREQQTQHLISNMPAEKLKDVTNGRLQLGPLQHAGVVTIADVLNSGERLTAIPGIGRISARRLHGAAQSLKQSIYDDTNVRIDVENPTQQMRDLVDKVSQWDTHSWGPDTSDDVALADAFQPLTAVLDKEVTHVAVFGGNADELISAMQYLRRQAPHALRQMRAVRPENSWQDFLRRPADYYAILEDLGLLMGDEDASVGGLPKEIVDSVRRCELDTLYLNASLRGYQSFAARFAIVQSKVIIGDEMGLGKTIEAIAVLAHLWAKGQRRSIVICPAAVITNWMREIESKSKLPAYRLHGSERLTEFGAWNKEGGVAVTTFEGLRWIEELGQDVTDLDCTVVDEAHFIKNPDAQRSQRSARMIEKANYAILLTGTPLENRVSEFQTLVEYIQPDLEIDSATFAGQFRKQIAPAYLRRNQEDVLTELPEVVQVEEWVPMSQTDQVAYRTAVSNSNIHEMRQAAMLQGTESTKLERLIEIVEEAEENGRKVIVFSFYLDVLNAAVNSLPGIVFGPLTGSVSPYQRQKIVDEFTETDTGAVLVSQITAGGVGLNIQSASVVVICEPQWKPTTEWQAIARAHRMGQLRSVQVHRLLSEDSVDQEIAQLLSKKGQTFEDYAAVSAMAESTPEAFDVSEGDLIRDVVAAERQRLFPELIEIDEG